jgi:hypothetical protein
LPVRCPFASRKVRRSRGAASCAKVKYDLLLTASIKAVSSESPEGHWPGPPGQRRPLSAPSKARAVANQTKSHDIAKHSLTLAVATAFAAAICVVCSSDSSADNCIHTTRHRFFGYKNGCESDTDLLQPCLDVCPQRFRPFLKSHSSKGVTRCRGPAGTGTAKNIYTSVKTTTILARWASVDARCGCGAQTAHAGARGRGEGRSLANLRTRSNVERSETAVTTGTAAAAARVTACDDLLRICRT